MKLFWNVSLFAILSLLGFFSYQVGLSLQYASADEGIMASSESSSNEAAKTEESSAAGQFGPGLAVTDFSKEDGYKMSDRALKKLGIGFKALQGKGPWSLPAEALVHIKQSTGVYRRYEGWITLVLVNVKSRKDGMVVLESIDLQAGDEVAVSGAIFLRMTDSDLNSETVDSCAH